MGLKNDGSKTYDYDYNPIMSSLDTIAQAERRLRAKKQVIEDLHNEYNLLEQQTLNTYKSHISYDYIQIGFIKKSIDWLKMKNDNKDKEGNKLDGRKKYDEQEIYNYLTSVLSDYLGINDMVITEIYDYNMAEGYYINFTSRGHKWELYIPNVPNISMKSFQCNGEYCFKLRLLHQDSPYCSNVVGSTFVEKELKDIFEKGLEKYEIK